MRYAIRGQLAISLHIGKRLEPYRETQNAAQPGPPERGNGKPGKQGNRETRTNREPIANQSQLNAFLLLPGFF